MRYLLIAEKPSLMEEIKKCYKKHRPEVVAAVGEMDFIALAGHLCRYAEPDEYPEWKDPDWGGTAYPMVPDKWIIRDTGDERKKKILADIQAKSRRADGIVVATDSDAEGYGIYYLIEQYLRLGDIPALRFVEHSLTDGEILKSLLSMTDYHTDETHANMTRSYVIRARADWLYGMNATRMLTVKCGGLMRVGRVKAPTVKLIYDNSKAIDDFVPEKYFIVTADYGSFKAVLTEDGGKEARFASGRGLPEYPLRGTVKSISSKRSTTHAPRLFDLTTAQAEAGRLYGLKPSRTLDIIQSLYEKHKAVSYPRTQCKFISAEKAEEFPELLAPLSAFPDLEPHLRRVTEADIARVKKDREVVNDREVEKESHDALLPTGTVPDLPAMTEDERKVCRMIYARFLAQFLPAAQDDRTDAYIDHGGYLFHAQGKTVTEEGWRALFQKPKESVLPPLREGDEITAGRIGPEERSTKAPKRLTQYSLVHAMENIADLIEDGEMKKSLSESKGIGTSATRAKIIDDIIKTGYAEDKKGALYITDAGKRYVQSLEGIDIIHPEFAAVMDMEIKRIQRGETDTEAVYKRVLEGLSGMCSQIEGMEGIAVIDERCPECGALLRDGRFYYECGECGWKAPRSFCGCSITREMLSGLLGGETFGPYHLKSRAGKKFMASLKIEDGRITPDFSPAVYTCPMCKKDTLQLKEQGLFCGCGFKAFRQAFGTSLTDRQLSKLAKDGETDEIRSFVSKKTGKKYSGILYIDEAGEVRMRFPDNAGTSHPEGMPCPACRERNVIINRGGAFCECGFKLYRKEFGAELTDDELLVLIKNGETGVISRFVSKKTKKEYPGILYIAGDGKVGIRFPDREEAF